ncbi:MAG: hypothetical protein MJZ26_03725 [Fibrobacter sp.]|nr:hypothetical protein [Fibrobacter sp.]
MDGYKKLIKSASLRRKILNILQFIPDSLMLRFQYRVKLHRSLNLKKPLRFTEKVQWYKLNYRNPVMHQCVDKFLVRQFVESKGLKNILVDLYGYFSSVDKIDFEKLPKSFVIKTTHGGGGMNVVVCSDKSTLDYDLLKQKLILPKHPVKKTLGREWAYSGLMPGIIVEELLVNTDNPDAGVNDYKIFCFNGKPEYLVVDVDRYIGHKRNFYTANWDPLNVSSDCPQADYDIPKPDNFDEMIKIASKLSEDFPFVRVDLYNISGKIYFGELTFYPWSGYVQYTPDEADFDFGRFFCV